ncbi:MAG TPA: helix-turn-helix domain-containing protein [Candidatus Polarisedimenticolia bacterium]|nr:helix-turn-helix domain-containing protein [Candidatus Polarisedimenticolia bacterium]
MSLGQRIKDLRAVLDMKQKELAEASGISQSTLCRIESGSVKKIDPNSLRRLAEALEVPAGYLVGEKGQHAEIGLYSDTSLRRILRSYRGLSPSGKRKLEFFVRFLEEGKKKRIEKGDT